VALLVVWLCSKQQAVACCLEEGEGKNRKKNRPAGLKGMGLAKGNRLGRIGRDGLQKGREEEEWWTA
jgi:hypothetical protein